MKRTDHRGVPIPPPCGEIEWVNPFPSLKALIDAIDDVNACLTEQQLLDLLNRKGRTWRRDMEPRDFHVLAAHCEAHGRRLRMRESVN